jgi:predicted nucleic acid-binding protein
VIHLDAYALIALALDEPAAADVERILRDGDVAIASVNLFEVLDYLVRRAGLTEADAHAHVSLVVGDAIAVTPVTELHARRGAFLRARHYRPAEQELSLADCVLLACAGDDDEIATADPALAAVARAEEIGLVPLPDTRGERP